MSNTTGSMTAALELKVKDTKKANQLIANLVANQKQTQNAIFFEYYKDEQDYYLYER